MQSHGFIQDEIQRKTLILYALSKSTSAMDFDVLTEICMCDDGMNYFQFSTAFANLIESENIVPVTDGVKTLYKITLKGAQSLLACQNELPLTVKHIIDLAVKDSIRDISRSSLISAEVKASEDGKLSAVCTLQDDTGAVLSMDMRIADEKHGDLVCRNFRRRAEHIYNILLTELSNTEN